MEVRQAQRIGYAVNIVMLSMIYGFLVLFIILDARFLIWFSIPTAVVYNLTFFLIYKKKLNYYLWTVYAWLILYTSVTAICLGGSYGFHLYCFSMIPCVYTTEYMSFKLGRKGVKSFYISLVIALYYVAFMSYLSAKGPVYDRGGRFSTFFLMFNSLTVFSYLVIYTNYLIRNIIRSEKKLTEMAHIDRLTGLYNRHYMLGKLSDIYSDAAVILAIADIDDFKMINDTYGHNAGDEVLRVISKKMKGSCNDCDIARWGGEEFLILCRDDENSAVDMLEKMREAIAGEPVVFEGAEIKVTITVGMSKRMDGHSVDEWIQWIDNLLYSGKKSGKNRVVHE